MLKLFFLALITSQASGSKKLGAFNVDTSSITISGLSSGAIFAAQYHVAYSKEVAGCGIISGLPYGCGRGGVPSIDGCLNHPEDTELADLLNFANQQQKAGIIDELEGLKSDKVFIFHGKLDHRILPENALIIKQFYEHFGSNIKTELSLDAAHGFPTDSYGAGCATYSPETQFINNCSYDTAFHTLNYLYGGDLKEPASNFHPENFHEFDQQEFGAGVNISMDETGYFYVPNSGCVHHSCRLHVSFHGCRQYRKTVGNIYATKTGYLEVAEANNLIILFPQAQNTAVNEFGCWDWYGYLNRDFLSKKGPQLQAVNNMVLRISGGLDRNTGKRSVEL